MDALAARLLDLLPQTQCTRCGYPDCAAYAEAIASGEAGIDQCPPGGAEGIARLARATGRAVTPLDPRRGVEAPRAVAFIDEAWCIGCTLCVSACPTDAIVGANKRMHTVIEAACTGCELCVPVCPVDCIVLESASGERTGWDAWSAEQAGQARERYAARESRLARAARIESERLAERALAARAPSPTHDATPSAPPAADARRAIIEAALAKARARQSPP